MASSADDERMLVCFFSLSDVYVHVVFARVFAEDHAFVNFDARPDEHFAALLNSPQRVGDGDARTVRDERAGGTHGHVADVVRPAFEDGIDQGGAARIGEKLAAQSDQAARREC